MSLALYRKYRSRNLDEVLGQNHVTTILKNALSRGSISHAYLLTGPRGTGKTSVARILAHEINQLPYTDDSSSLDIIEIDAASNNGVDDIRNLREKSQIIPVSAKFKVYIIDEVHMLSKPAFNALLKTLEEPPSHVVFILATTDVDKLPATIISRVQHFHFRPLSKSVIAPRLVEIAKLEGFTLEPEAAELIADRSRGGFRDSISLLDQLSVLANKKIPLTKTIVAESLGLANNESIARLIDLTIARDGRGIIEQINSLELAGVDSQTMIDQLLNEARSRLAEHPDLTTIIQGLIDAPRSQYPSLKVITTLLDGCANITGGNQPKPITPSSNVSELKLDKPPATQQKSDNPPAVNQQVEPTTQQSTADLLTDIARPQTTSTDLAEFSWDKLVSEIKKQSFGLYSLLSSCNYSFSDNTLTISTSQEFNKKKLEDSKNHSVITQVLASSSLNEVDVVIKKEGPRSANQDIVDIIAIMGGGEELSMESIS